MNKRLSALLQRKAAAVDKMKAIRASAGEELFSAEQSTAFDAAKAEATQLEAAIAAEREAIEIERTSAAAGTALDIGAASLEVGVDRRTLDATHGFRNFGEFVSVAYRRQINGVQDDRLAIGAAATTYGSEGSLADGGFLVPPEFSSQVWNHSLEEDAFLPMTDVMPISGNSMSYPKDETTPWGTDGVRAYWEAEAAAATATKPKGQVNTLRMNKLMALIPVTDELQADAPALGAYISGKAAESIRWKTNEALFAGTGVGQPEGVFASSARVDVAKESGQAADTVVAANVANMYARQLRATRSVWLIQPQVMPQIMVMTIGNQPIWTPPTAGFQGAPMGMLLGRPIYSTEVCKALGDVGDIGFIDWKSVRSITKSGGIETATSMHLYFDQGMNAFRFTFRVDAKPAQAAAVSSKNGGAGATRSPFVFLAARA
jgi:HK97 family phage major capsid protein